MAGSRPCVLVIAATDSSGGAGLTRDVEALADFGVQARCAVTAVTVQTDAQLLATHPIPAEVVRSQIHAALEAGVAAIKIGMLGTAATLQAVVESLPSRDQLPIVLDPVLRSTSGASLLEATGLELLRRQLLPRVTLVTPNVPEAAALLGQPRATDASGYTRQLRELLALGPQAVLLKGGHAAEGAEVVDRLAQAGQPLVSLRVARAHATRRGTGCSGASAIAAQLAYAVPLVEACARAQAYVASRLAGAGPAGTRSEAGCLSARIADSGVAGGSQP